MLLTIRPERLQLARSGHGWPARIVRVTYLGARLDVQVRFADGTAFTASEVDEGRIGVAGGRGGPGLVDQMPPGSSQQHLRSRHEAAEVDLVPYLLVVAARRSCFCSSSSRCRRCSCSRRVPAYGGHGGRPPISRWENYTELLSSPLYRGAILRSFVVGTCVGRRRRDPRYLLAYFLTRDRERWRSALVALSLAPLLASVIVRTYGWWVVLNREGALDRCCRAWV